MGFRTRRFGRRFRRPQRSQVRFQPRRTTTASSRTAPRTTATAHSTPANQPNAQPAQDQVDKPASEPGKTSMGQQFMQGFSNLLGGEGNPLKTLANASRPFEFSDSERKTAEAGLHALTKMAGEDGVLTPDDRANIVGQMDGALTQEKNRQVNSIANQQIAAAKNGRPRFLRRLAPNAPLISRIGEKKRHQALRDPAHMHTARQTALNGLNDGLSQLGMDPSGGVNLSEGRRQARTMQPISLADTQNLERTMRMIEQKAKARGLPEGKFERGLPVDFLRDVLNGTPAIGLRKHQVNPRGL